MRKDNTKPGVVYVVVDKREPDRVRYVGRTVQDLSLRVRDHWRGSDKLPGAFPNWLKSRQHRKEDVLFKVESFHPSVDELNEAEIEAIRHYRGIDQADLNMTDGGDGAVGLQWTDRRKETHNRRVRRGEEHYNHKLTWDNVRAIREEASESTVKSTRLSEKYGVSVATVTEVLRNETWFDPNYNPQNWKKTPYSGETARNARLTKEQVSSIRKTRQERYIPAREMSQEYGVSKDMIQRILAGKNWVDENFDPGTVVKRGSAK